VVRFSAQAYSFPKDLTAPEEWEDSAAYSVRTGRFAVADGAAAAYRAGEWAEQLTRAYITSFPAPAGFPSAPEPVGPERLQAVQEWFAEQVRLWREGAPAPTTWWARDAAASRPSSATFAGLYLTPHDTAAFWEVSAIGDSCLFHISHGQLMRSFPMSPESRFNKHPDLLTTAQNRLEGSLAAVQIRTGQALPGDIFVLATDAASELLLGIHINDALCLGQTGFFGSGEFFGLMKELRKNQAIEVDDVAMVVVAVRP